MKQLSFKRFAYAAVGVTVSLVAFSACSASGGADAPPGQGSGGDSSGTGGDGSSGDNGSGGTQCGGEFGECSSGGSSSGGSSGSKGSGGSSGGGGDLGPGLGIEGSTILLCPGENIVNIPVDSFDTCDYLLGCGHAHCLATNLIPPGVPVNLLSKCPAPDTVCVPDDYTRAYGKFQAKSCTAILGVEGRCISTCIAQVNGLMDVLKQEDCGANERCAPCFNPNDGLATGACTQGCDEGPSADTQANIVKFVECQNGEGRCVTKDLIPPALLSHLVQYTCKVDEVCAPLSKTQDLKYNFDKCDPTNFSGLLGAPNPDGQKGGCVPAWLADGNLLEALFIDASPQCQPGEKCAPCNNPIRPDPAGVAGQMATGACPVPLPTDPSGGRPPGVSPGGGGSPDAGTP